MTLITQKFLRGDFVYYTNSKGDTIPTRIKAVKFRMKTKKFLYLINVSIEAVNERLAWRTDKNIKLQEKD